MRTRSFFFSGVFFFVSECDLDFFSFGVEDVFFFDFLAFVFVLGLEVGDFWEGGEFMGTGFFFFFYF